MHPFMSSFQVCTTESPVPHLELVLSPLLVTSSSAPGSSTRSASAAPLCNGPRQKKRPQPSAAITLNTPRLPVLSFNIIILLSSILCWQNFPKMCVETNWNCTSSALHALKCIQEKAFYSICSWVPAFCYNKNDTIADKVIAMCHVVNMGKMWWIKRLPAEGSWTSARWKKANSKDSMCNFQNKSLISALCSMNRKKQVLQCIHQLKQNMYDISQMNMTYLTSWHLPCC